MRIRRHDDPAFEATVTPGVRLARGSSNAARIEDAKRVWASLRGPKWGPQVYARALYGPGVSCLSYVSTRGGRSEQRTTLLGSDVSQLTPEQIAWQLIDLAAMRHLFHNEATQRVEFFRLSQQLKEKEQEVSRAQETVTVCPGKPRRSAGAARCSTRPLPRETSMWLVPCRRPSTNLPSTRRTARGIRRRGAGEARR